jgi:hypothetical protein
MNALPLKQLQADLLKKYPELERLDLYPSGSDIRLDAIIVKRQFRKSGIGSKVLNDIKSFANSNSKRIILITGVKDSAWGTTSSSRLDKFYRRNGFVANKNRNKDYTITATHYYSGKQKIKESAFVAKIGNNGTFNPNSTNITEMKHPYRTDATFEHEYDIQEKRRKPKKKKREIAEDKLEQRSSRVNFKNYLRDIKEQDLDEDY